MTDIAPPDSSAPTSARATSPSSSCARPLPASITYGIGWPGRVVTGVCSAMNVVMAGILKVAYGLRNCIQFGYGEEAARAHRGRRPELPLPGPGAAEGRAHGRRVRARCGPEPQGGVPAA